MRHMVKPQVGINCPGCPHRAAFVVVRDAVRRGRGHVFCGNTGCAVVGTMHPQASTTPGGDAALLPRYRQAVPTGDEDARASVCCHFVLADELMGTADPADGARDGGAYALDHLAAEGEVVLLCILAAERRHLAPEALDALCARARELGALDAAVLDPFDTADATTAAAEAARHPGVHALVFASPCAQLMGGAFSPAEIDRLACAGCRRCSQITGCPALVFEPPVFQIDADACAGCDLCADYCRTNIIYSERQRQSPAERHAARMAAALR